MLLENNPYPSDVRVRREALSLVAAGHAVTVIAPRGPGQARREVVDGVRVRRFRLPAAGGSGATGFVGEYLVANLALHWAAVVALARGATVLHLHNPPDTLFGAGALARVLGRRVVFDSHDLFPEFVRVRFGDGTLARFAALCERATFGVASAVLAANESHAEVAIGRGRVAPDAVTIVRNGPPAASVAATPAVRPGALTEPRLVYVGSIAEQDGVTGLAEVLAAVPGARLTVVGDGDALPALEEALRAHGVAGRAHVTGWVELDEVPALIAQADICVDPAPATELNDRSTMIKVAEYLAAGKPVVAYDLLETRRTAGDAAVLVTPGDAAAMADAITQLAGDAGRREALATAALERVQELTWERSEQALLAAYAAL